MTKWDINITINHQVMKFIISVVCLLMAGCVAMTGHDAWGWFLFGAATVWLS